jgi:hypothetical protein
MDDDPRIAAKDALRRVRPSDGLEFHLAGPGFLFDVLGQVDHSARHAAQVERGIARGDATLRLRAVEIATVAARIAAVAHDPRPVSPVDLERGLLTLTASSLALYSDYSDDPRVQEAVAVLRRISAPIFAPDPTTAALPGPGLTERGYRDVWGADPPTEMASRSRPTRHRQRWLGRLLPGRRKRRPSEPGPESGPNYAPPSPGANHTQGTSA